jgi:sec-independent protein translocase protein TatA
MGLENPIHLLLVLVVVLMVFGAKKLPEMGTSLGSGLRGFKQAISGEHVDQLPEMTVTPMTDAGGETASNPASNNTAPTSV